jgi:hypothetical protein
LKAAVIGFSLFRPILEWGKANFEYVDGYLYGEPSIASLCPSEESYEATLAFAGLSLGAFAGMYEDGRLKEDELSKVAWYILAFTSLNSIEIGAIYRSIRQTDNELS